MNELLQKHGCNNVFTLPEGLKELMSDISREVLREQPAKIFDFIANYLSVLLITREHGVMATSILDDLCDCKSSVSKHLMQLGMPKDQAQMLALIIKEEIEGFEPVEGKEKVKESQIIKKILTRTVLDEEMSSRVCQVTRNAYKDYWYRKKMLEQNLKVKPDEPWQIAAQRTLELYKRTKPSFNELARATEKIQAAYRGYYIRKKMLKHLKPKPKRMTPKSDLPGPPPDIAASREIDLGPIIDIQTVREDNVNEMFNEYVGEVVGLKYDPMKTITHVETVDQSQIRAPSIKILTALDMKSKQDPREARHSKVVSPAEVRRHTVDISRQASVIPPMYTELSLNKISFAEEPPQVISFEVDEEIAKSAVDDVKEVQEAIDVASAEAVDADEFAEVLEDLPDNMTDGSSAQTESVPTSAHDTPDITDEEEADG